MKSTTVRRVGLSIAVATALASVAACDSMGSSGGSGKDDKAAGKSATLVSSIAALRSAEQSTDRADSAKVESSTVLGSVMSMDAKGNLAWDDGITGTLTMTYTGGTVARTMRAAGSTSMEARYLPDAYYAKMGEKFAAQAGGRHWLKYDYDDLAKLGGSSGAYLRDQMQNSTPNQSVKLLLASGDVEKVGTESVRGRRTTHYSGTVNVADLATKNSNLTASQLAGLKKQLTAAGVATEQVDIWVDAQNLLVKKVEKGAMSSGRYSQTAYYSDYGVKVDATVPPADDTEDFTALLKKQGLTPGSGDTATGSGTSS
ncbi:hypothetical protein [Streptomyces prunicolor]|uniref:Lipoprotein n=1 Tax=Streptomyces prunicolor TaxID=67348 RepID=A0ABU4F806_9ACTN|nr:hypothetical protein [Streptomyces prunicolor]MDV7216729.1 hypothetical protein [Streptomyces prunicolor]